MKKVETFALDSARTTDENGFLRVKLSHITKATVNPYRGCEIPNYQQLGLKPEAIYYALRDPKELQKSLETWKGLPLHLEHHIDDAINQAKDTRVGNVGTDPTWNAPYIDATLTVWDNEAIKKINDGTCKEISCAYRYDPDFTAGYYNGEPYDFVMRNIRGNHVALVEEGRAGHDVVVADSKKNLKNHFIKGDKKMAKFNLKHFFKGALDSDQQNVENEEMQIGKTVEKLGKALQDLHETNAKGEIVDINLDADTVEEIKEKYDISDEDLKVLIKLFANQKAEDEAKQAQDADISVSVKDDTTDEVQTQQQPIRPTLDNEQNAEDEDLQAQDEDIEKALQLAGLENASDEVKQAFIKGLKAQKMANDEEEEDKEIITKEDLKVAEDRALQRMQKHFKAKLGAVNKVAPLVGRLDPMAFDSARDVYKYALNKAGIKTNIAQQGAFNAMIDTLLQAKGKNSNTRFATDSNLKAFSFEKNLKNIRVED